MSAFTSATLKRPGDQTGWGAKAAALHMAAANAKAQAVVLPFPQFSGHENTGAEQAAPQVCVATLYRDYAHIMRAYLIRHNQSEDDAADIIQDVFARIVRLRNPSGILDNPKAYLLRAAMNMLHDRYRHNRSRQMNAHDPIDDQVVISAEPSPESRLVWRQALENALKALQAAGPSVSHVVALSCLSDATYPEIARRLGVTPRTIERYMQRARNACLTHAADLPFADC